MSWGVTYIRKSLLLE